MTDEEKIRQIQGYLNWTEDEFHLEVPEVRKVIRRIIAGVSDDD